MSPLRRDETDALLAELTVCYSSLADRAADIRVPDHPDVEVVVVVQGDGEVPDFGPRVRVLRQDGRGVARSRNAALDAATRRYLLFCDDDVRVTLPGVAAGIALLRSTGAAVGLGRGADPEGSLRKSYSPDGAPLNLYNTGRAATYEMLVDVEQVREAGIRFDERFGAGGRYFLGDEYIFIADALRAGLEGVAVGRVFGVHPVDSSGSRWGTPDDRQARAIVVNRVFGRQAFPARVAFALRHRSRLGAAGALRFAADRRQALPHDALADAGALNSPPHDTSETTKGATEDD